MTSNKYLQYIIKTEQNILEWRGVNVRRRHLVVVRAVCNQVLWIVEETNEACTFNYDAHYRKPVGIIIPRHVAVVLRHTYWWSSTEVSRNTVGWWRTILYETTTNFAERINLSFRFHCLRPWLFPNKSVHYQTHIYSLIHNIQIIKLERWIIWSTTLPSGADPIV